MLATSSTDAGSSAQADVQNGLQQCVDTVPTTSHNECVTPSLSNNPSPFLPPAQELSTSDSKPRAVFFEIFAGCGQLSLSMKSKGFLVVPVDYQFNKHDIRVEQMSLDLTTDEGQSCLMGLLRELKPAAIHVALPCGTGSRARERPIAPHLIAKGAPQPRPLRDADNILGFPDLSSRDHQRVTLSNRLASFTVQLLIFAMETFCFISIENPVRSWMFAVIAHYVRELNQRALSKFWNDMVAVDFANCAHGGERDKKTRFLCSSDIILELAMPCPGNHVHKPFGLHFGPQGWIFDTAIEGEYPKLLCDRYADACVAALTPRFSFITPHSNTTWQQNKRSAPLVPEYQRIVWQVKTPSIPHKLLEPPQGGSNSGAKAKFGIYHTPKQFVEAAKRACHPFDQENAIPDILKENIFNLFTKGSSFVTEKRLQSARKIAQLQKELASEETRFHQTLPEHAQTVLKGKNILLLRHLLREEGFEDLHVPELMTGVDLVGVPSKSPLFEVKFVPACTNEQFLMWGAKCNRSLLLSRNIHENDPELAKILWDVTLEEQSKGFLQGPFDSEQDVQSFLGVDDFVCSRRFAIMQGGKPRIIDDLKESLVNSAFTSLDKLCLHDIDFLTSLCMFIANISSGGSEVSVSFCDGSRKQSTKCAQFLEAVSWQAKCFDLAKAYKQVPVSTSSRKLGVLMVHRPESGVPAYFVTRSLPFGACGSVFAFNRISRSLWYLGAKMFLLNGGCFYDDFPMIEPTCSSRLAAQSFELLLSSLGWLFSTDPSKTFDFAARCDVLGVTLDVSSLGAGELRLETKPSRFERLKTMFENFCRLGTITRRDAQAVHGLLNFMLGAVMGRSLKVVCRAFSNLAAMDRKLKREDVEHLCEWAANIISQLQPRVLTRGGITSSVLVFTDAAYEAGVATWGIVLIDELSGTTSVISGVFPGRLVARWTKLAGDQVITQAEACAALLARRNFVEVLSQRRVVFYIDNEAARFSLIKSASPSLTLMRLTQLFHQCGDIDCALCWIERVPSAANIADLPSRNCAKQAADILGGEVVPLSVCIDELADEVVVLDDLPSSVFQVGTFSSFDPVATVPT